MEPYNPWAIIKRPLSGSGNMGDVLDRDNRTARFSWDKSRFILAQVRINFTGTGNQGVATMQMLLDHHSRQDGISSPFDFVLETWDNMGFDASATNYYKFLEWSPRYDQWHRFVFEPQDAIVFEWTDPGTTDWAIELGIIPQGA